MLKRILIIFIFPLPVFLSAQVKDEIIPNNTYKPGEQLKYLVHFGFIDGGVAGLFVEELDVNGKKIHHAKATGKSVGITDKLFKVRDVYETFIDAGTGLPVKAIRDISEDTYKYYDEVLFNRKENFVITKRKGKVRVPENTIDILSAFYYARRAMFSNLKQGDILKIDTYFDDGIFTLEIRYKGTQTIKTKLGKINCLIFSPVVEPGRIFDTENDVTIWISNDNNFLPIRIQFDLMVGSLKCDLVEYENLKNNFALSK
ncbi:MAG: hypothetical protein COX07_02415 [Bacteroidetes bacterium CG23_combo_of_CG06-09_8_20_14_all_32_9]|nr:MAG: hypothetical protein COX07_02415 [Bacteroidetes bacterium CG23_combo_of_CG06-09_8_20_14_all_32_9]